MIAINCLTTKLLYLIALWKQIFAYYITRNFFTFHVVSFAILTDCFNVVDIWFYMLFASSLSEIFSYHGLYDDLCIDNW